MKTTILYISFFAVCSLVFNACKKEEIITFSGMPKIQFIDSAALSYTFIYEPEARVVDTVWLAVRTIGGIKNYDRPIVLTQTPEFRDSIRIDEDTKKIIDTLHIPVSNPAVAGVHYVALDDPALKPYYVMKANQVEAKMPVVVLRDPSLKESSYRLRLMVKENAEFVFGETKNIARTLIVSDRFERFYSWRFDTSVAPAFFAFGKYSPAKHQFMYETIGAPIDEEWYTAVVAIGGVTHYRNYLREALQKYNADPVNIASGKAPLREGGGTSPLVTF
ncbi:DUF4843 domain-containing protein [Sphingobacterium sp. Mn56C]|uniref:DUF4843 domain-containing protein n=1 Tax=Sphingobacterium sp. Mn56C TaxID=3395261 RepID=UPI003BDE0527